MLKSMQVKTFKEFCIEQIQNDDDLIRFYTGFASFKIFLAFLNFLALLYMS